MKAIKAFAPFAFATMSAYQWCRKAAKSARTAEVIGHYMARDPASTQWERSGWVAPFDEGRPVHDLDGVAYLLMHQTNQRILPGAVRDEKLLARVTELADREGRELTKQEYAQLREEVELELLPQAFIRRTMTPVFIYKKYIVICSSSAKKHQDVIQLLSQMLVTRDVDADIEIIYTMRDLGPEFKKAVHGDALEVGEEACYFEASDAAVFKGSDKRTLRIKDRNLHHKDVQQALIEGSYGVTELRTAYKTADGDKLADVTITDKLIFKGLKLAETPEMKSAEDAHATYFIYSRQIINIVTDLIDALGGRATSDDEDGDL